MLERVRIGDFIYPRRVRVGTRVVIVDTVDTVFGDENLRRTDLQCALRGDRVRRKIRETRAGTEDDNTALFQVTNGAKRDVRLCNLSHLDCRLNPNRLASLFQKVLEREGVHDRSQHAHVVGTRTIHAALAEFCTAEEVASSDNDGNLHVLCGCRNLSSDSAHDVGVNPQSAPAKSFTGQFE